MKSHQYFEFGHFSPSLYIKNFFFIFNFPLKQSPNGTAISFNIEKVLNCISKLWFSSMRQRLHWLVLYPKECLNIARISSLFCFHPVWKWKYVTFKYTTTSFCWKNVTFIFFFFIRIKMMYYLLASKYMYLVSVWKNISSWFLNVFLEYAQLGANYAYVFKIHMGNQRFRPRALDVSVIGNFALSLY